LLLRSATMRGKMLIMIRNITRNLECLSKNRKWH
jgi:hypothetical protein